jgi:O-antigen/teichoic acid export membrane protein
MTDESRLRPIARQPIAEMRALWSALDAAATPGFALVTLAVLVRALSAADYGLLVVALAASGLSMAVNPAIAATTTKFVSELSGQRHLANLSLAGVITLSLIAVAAIDLVILLGAALFSEPLSRWVFGPAVANAHVTAVLLLAVLSVAIQQIDSVLAAAIRGLERFRRQALIEIFSRGTLTAVIIFVAWSTGSIAVILAAQSAMYFASALVRAVALRELLPGKRLFAPISRDAATRIIGYGGWMWLTALAGVAYTSADRIIIGRSVGAAAAGQYNVYLQITQVIHFIPSSVFAFALPAFSRLAMKGSAGRDEILRTYRMHLRITSVAAVCLAAAMMTCWPFLLRALVGSGSAGGSFYVPLLLILNFLLLACMIAPYYLLIALGHARTVSTITTMSMLAALALMAALIPRYGMEGAAVARLAYGVGALLLLWKARRLLKQQGPIQELSVRN